MEELKPGEFVVNEDGSVEVHGKHGGVLHLSAESIVDYFAWKSVDEYTHWLARVGFTRLYPKSQGSEIKEEATPLLDILASAETARSPLPNSDAWRYTDKRVDRWAGFVVDKMDINMPSDPWKNNRHPLQRLNESTSHQLAKQGSAWLLEKKV